MVDAAVPDPAPDEPPPAPGPPAPLKRHPTARPVTGPEGPRPEFLIPLAGFGMPASLGPTLAVGADGSRLRVAEWIGHAPRRTPRRALVLVSPDGDRRTVAIAHPGKPANLRPGLPAGLLAGLPVPDPGAPGGPAAFARWAADALAPLPFAGGPARG